jgi:hypothetical protein
MGIEVVVSCPYTGAAPDKKRLGRWVKMPGLSISLTDCDADVRDAAQLNTRGLTS